MILDQADLLAGRYKLLDRIGSGGMGVVWSADDRLLRRQVAIKEVHPDHENRMRHEAQVGAKVSHPNVVTVYDLVYEDGKPWLVMRLVHSRSLAAVLADDGPLDPKQAATMGRQLLAGLMAVHAQGVVHCDVKPGNVLLDERDDAHLTDFGIAADTGSRMVGTLFGAPSYIAPERARGLPMGPASDLWSLGATLYAAVEGHPPVDRGDPLATVTAIVTERPEPPTHAAALRPVIDGLLAADPADRPGVAELDRMLRQVSEGTASISISRPLPRHLSPASAPSLRGSELSLPRHRAVGTATGFTPPPTPSPTAEATALSNAEPEPTKGTPSTDHAIPGAASVRVHATTALHLPKPPLLHRAPLVLLGLTAGIAAGLLWFGGHVPAPSTSEPARQSSEAPAANPEAVAVQPSAKPAAAPAAQAPAQAPARAPEAFSGSTSAEATVEATTEAPVTSAEPPAEITTTVAPTTTEAPTTTVATTEAGASTPPPNGA